MSFLSKIIVAGKQLLEINDGTPFVTTSGTSSAYTVTIPEFTDIVDGMKLLVRFHLDNEANATITINSLTAVLLGVSGDEATPIPAGTIKKDSVWLIVKSENRWLLTNYAGDYSQLTEQINAKQDKLVSGTNIKTVNNQSLVGSGNVSIDTGVDLTTAQTISGVKTFTSLPIIPTDTPNSDEQVASKKYVDDTKTELSTLINGKQDNISGAATSIVTNNLTANRTLISDGSGKVSVSNITSTELNYLDGVSSNIQTQLNSKQSTLVSGTNIKTVNNNSLLGEGNISIDIGMDLSSAQTVTGIKTFNALPISNATPSSANQLTTKSYVDNAIANKTSEPIVCEYFRWGPQLPNGTVLNEGGSFEWNQAIWESISTGSIVQYTSAADGSTQNTVVILSYYTTTGTKSGGGRYWTNTLSYALGTALHSISISFDLSGNYVAGTSFSGGVACFTPETLIDTPNGLTPIKDIKEGDNVYTLDKDNCIQIKPIIKTFNHTVNNLIQFTVGNETFKASETHPFLTKDRGYVTAKFLCVGDILFDKDGKEKCITDIKLLDVDNTTVYEIRPQDNENYFIGNQSIFVYCEAI